VTTIKIVVSHCPDCGERLQASHWNRKNGYCAKCDQEVWADWRPVVVLAPSVPWLAFDGDSGSEEYANAEK
jgi:ribosomal protein S27AE